MNKVSILTLVLLTSLFAGCAGPKYTASPMENKYRNISTRIVIINDEKTREGF